jgi:hypothetical protein
MTADVAHSRLWAVADRMICARLRLASRAPTGHHALLIVEQLSKRSVAMQQCGHCLKIYDESEDAHCPFCFEDDERPTLSIVFDKVAGVAKVVPKEDAHLYD